MRGRLEEVFPPIEIIGHKSNSLFEYDALKAARRTAALQVGPTGKPLNVSLDTLVCSRGYAVHNRAEEILGAINKGWIPGSADRDTSAVPQYKIVASPWITTNTLYWFIKVIVNVKSLLINWGNPQWGLSTRS